jgi:hypothetical protein
MTYTAHKLDRNPKRKMSEIVSEMEIKVKKMKQKLKTVEKERNR